MFIRQKKNKSGSFSIQIIEKIGRRNKILKTVGVAKTEQEIDFLKRLAKFEIEKIKKQTLLFRRSRRSNNRCFCVYTVQ